MKVKVYKFSKGFLMFITNRDETERDIKGDENKIKQFLRDSDYKQRGDTKINRSKLIRRMLASIGEPTSQVISTATSSEDEEEEEEEETDYENDKQLEASGLNEADRNKLIEI